VKHQFASGTINTYHTRPRLIIKDKKKGRGKKIAIQVQMGGACLKPFEYTTIKILSFNK
jgi:hypothetical protein